MNSIALIVVDMQRGMKSPEAGERNNPEAESIIFSLLSAWRKFGAPIVHVRHVSKNIGSSFWPGQSGVEFQAELSPLAGEQIFEKNVADAFCNSGLERWLLSRSIRSVAFVGVSTNISIESSVRSAGCLGFNTYVASDATFAFAKYDFNGVLRSPEEVHSMALANLSGEFAKVVRAKELFAMLEASV